MTHAKLMMKCRHPNSREQSAHLALHHQAEVFTDILRILLILQLRGVWKVNLEPEVVPPAWVCGRCYYCTVHPIRPSRPMSRDDWALMYEQWKPRIWWPVGPW